MKRKTFSWDDKNKEHYEKRRCKALRKDGLRCGSYAINGWDVCYFHMTPEQKQRYNRGKLNRTSDSDKTGLCTGTNKDGSPCKNKALPGWSKCWSHATSLERQAWKRRRRNRPDTDPEQIKRHDPSHKEPKYKVPRHKGKRKARKEYDGYKGAVNKEVVVEVDGEIYGFYGGSFLSAAQRELFKQAPVGDIDDDIRVVRFLIRDALYNQQLYLQARENGSVDDKGFVIFSREKNTTVDETGHVIAETTRTIRRKRDYLEDIQRLERLLTSMEQARIDIKKAADEFEDAIQPFSFNVLPPSDDHPIYGKDSTDPEPEKETEGGAE